MTTKKLHLPDRMAAGGLFSQVAPNVPFTKLCRLDVRRLLGWIRDQVCAFAVELESRNFKE